MPSIRSVLTNLRAQPTRDDHAVPRASIGVRVDTMALFGFIVELNDENGITGIEFAARTPSVSLTTQTKRGVEPYIDVHYLLYAMEFWLLAFLLDDESAMQLRCRASDCDFAELTRTLGERFCPEFTEDGQEMYWFAKGIAGDPTWLPTQIAFLARINDGIVCATEGDRSLFTDDGDLTASAEIVIRAVALRVRSRASLLGRLLSVLKDEQSEDVPSSSVRSYAPASAAA